MLKEFIDNLVQISQESYRLLMCDFERVFAEIDEKIGEQEIDQEMAELLVSLEEERGR